MIDLDSLDGITIIDKSSVPTQGDAQRPTSKESSGVGDSQISAHGSDGYKLLTCMLITANVGTIFEEATLLELWFKQLKCYLTKLRPQLVAIHCQEVGGKNYETSMRLVSGFIDKIICDNEIVGDYSRIRIFLDENFKNLEQFTALGSLYLIHDSVESVKLYNFKTAQYDDVGGRQVFNGNYTNEAAENVEKVKFPPDLFPECRWSRKGFMRTRWLLNDVQPLDLVNIHLFHDASNLIAMKSTPSPYAQNRQRALQFALQTISSPLRGTWIRSDQESQVSTKASDQESTTQNQPEVPLFIFGDFNFRLDTNKVVQRITEGVSPIIKRSANNNEVLKVVYHRKTSTASSLGSPSLLEDTSAFLRSPDVKVPASVSNKTCISDNNLESQSGAAMDEGQALQAGERDDINEETEGGVVMTIGKKLFDCENLDETFRATKNTEWLQELDNELDSFRSKLFEFKISFSPSYPFKEDTTGGYSYMKTRCPAWCDRILFNEAGFRIINGNDATNEDGHPLDSDKMMDLLQNDSNILYRLMGSSVPMGDHKPVLLYCQLKLGKPNTEPIGTSL